MLFNYSTTDKINYSIVGNGKIKILFLHGFGASSNSWNYIINLFNKEKYTLYLIDLLGHGHSSYNNNSDYSIVTQSNIVQKLIEFLRLDDFIIIGHSYGGSISLLLMILHKNNINVEKLILIDVGAFPNEIPFFIRYLNNPILEIFIRIFLPKYLKAYFALRQLYFNKKLITEDRIKKYSKFYHNKQWKALVKAAKNIIPNNFENLIKEYSTINIPTLILWGKNDAVISQLNGKKLQGRIINSCLKIIEDCGHIPQEENPTETYNAIKKFIDSC